VGAGSNLAALGLLLSGLAGHLIYSEIPMGAVAKSYMRKGFLIYEEMRKYLTIYEEAVSLK
jgi:hypothetical protein